MKTLLPLIPSYIKKNSFELIKELKSHHLPPSAKLVTADASSMYTYIDTTTGIQAMQDLFELFHEHIPTNFPRDFFLTTLEINMKNNIFSFGDTFWLQLQGTAMGTPEALLYCIITYGVHENTHILTTFNENLVYYKRYIDNIIGIWIDSPHNSWENFKNQLNGFGALKWNTEDLTTSTTFIDLTISKRDQKIQKKIKKILIYIYISHLYQPTQLAASRD